MSEFRYNPELKVGDTVEVYIENQEDKKGQLVLSHRKARATRSLGSRKRSFGKRRNLSRVNIKCRTKGWYDCRRIRHRSFLAGFSNRT